MKKAKKLFILLAVITLSMTFITGFTGKGVTAASEEGISMVEGLMLHYDAQSEKMENGSSVQRLTNLTGGSNAISESSASSPTFIESGTIFGKPSIRFTPTSYFTVENSESTYLSDMTIFVVINIDALSEHGEILSRLAGSPWNHNWYLNIEGGLLNYGWSTSNNGAISYPQSKVTVATDTPMVLMLRKDGINGSVSVNGETVSTFLGSTACNPVNAPILVGGNGNGVTADIGEILVYDRGISDADAIVVQRYLESRWGLENAHEGLLSDLKVKGESVAAFRSDITEYVIITSEGIKESDVSYSLWTPDDKAEIKKSDGGVDVVVTGTKTGKQTIYKIRTKAMNYKYNEIQKLSANEVKINDGFWSGFYKQYSVRTVNFMFDMFDKTKSFDNFDRVAAGEKKTLGNTSEHAAAILKAVNDRDVYNTEWVWTYEPWREGLIYEGIRAASQFITVNRANPEFKDEVLALEERLNGYVDRIYAAALKTTAKDGNGKPIDGYFSTFNILDRLWVCDETDVSARYHHDLYNYGCLVEAALYHYNATGDTRLLMAATRFTEFIIDYVNGRDGFVGYKVVPPHELPEEALQRLYELYKANPDLVKLIEDKYSCLDGMDPSDRYYKLKVRLDEYAKIVKSWITDRGNPEGRYNLTSYGSYAQDNVTYDKLSEATGHAVRANLWYNGIAYVGARQQNDDFVAAAERIWRNITKTQMYVTGGTGSTHDGDEAYGGNNVLPHNGYCETCASVGMAFFSQNMFYLFGTAEYAEDVELQTYNNILGCLGLDGTSFYYTNPMVSDNYDRPMFSNATPCCVPMFLKYYSELPEIIYAKTDKSIFVNQYVSSSLQTRLGSGDLTVIQGTDMPNGNKAQFALEATGELTVKLRVPAWAKSVTLLVNGNQVDVVEGADGYVDVSVSAGKTTLSVEFGKEIERIYQDYAEENKGKVAFRYGSFVYCAEDADNTSEKIGKFISRETLSVSKNAGATVSVVGNKFKYEQSKNIFVPLGVNVITVEATVASEKADLVLVPYWLRGNRTKGHMQVWFNEQK